MVDGRRLEAANVPMQAASDERIARHQSARAMQLANRMPSSFFLEIICPGRSDGPISTPGAMIGISCSAPHGSAGGVGVRSVSWSVSQ